MMSVIRKLFLMIDFVKLTIRRFFFDDIEDDDQDEDDTIELHL